MAARRGAAEGRVVKPLSREELRTLPATTDLPTLGRAFGISEPIARERHRRGEFAALGIRIVRLGAKWRVITADMLQALGVTQDDDPASTDAGPSSRHDAEVA